MAPHVVIGPASILAALCVVCGAYLVFDARRAQESTGGVLLVALGIAIAYIA